MRKGNILPIAIMAFAIGALLLIVFWAITPGLKYPWSTNTTKTSNVDTATDGKVLLSGSVFYYGCMARPSSDRSPCGYPAASTKSLIIYASDGRTEVANQNYGAQGAFSVRLAPGTYVLDFGPSPTLPSQHDTKEVTLSAGHDITGLKVEFANGIQ